ncbi:MAG: hypothetical protein HFG65_03025 [Hungatella sp.]|nr:hypothetical protein [Hungatella sp.]
MTISSAAKNICDTLHTYEMLALPDISFDNFEEVLSDTVYWYSRKTNQISIAFEK